MKQDSKNLDRRKFLKAFGAEAGLFSAALCGCGKEVQTDPSAASPDAEPKGKMTFRNSKKGDKVSLLGYGCMRWPLIPGKDGKDEQVDQQAVNRLVDYAIEHGVNYFDTAPVYVRGMSERATGAALKRHPREKYFVATKMSNFSDYSRENSIAIYKNSFKELQVDYIDYYLLHSVGGGDGINTLKKRFFDNGILDFLLKERQAGRIRHLGFSFHGDVSVYNYLLNCGVDWDFVMIQMNYLDWKHASGRNINAEYLYGELEKRKIPTVVMEPLLGGRLSNVPNRMVARYKQRDPSSSVASWSFRFIGTHPNIMTVLSGMAYKEHLLDNLRTYSPLMPLDESEMQFLEENAKLLTRFPLISCNDCGYCMPCDYAIDIPGVLLHYNKCVNEDCVPQSVAAAEYEKLRRKYLVGYGREVPKLRQADRCTGCKKCVPLCPQRVDVPKEMRRISRFVERLRNKAPLMADVMEKMRSGNYSCVIAKDKMRTFTGRGVSDLLNLLKNEPAFLKDSIAADKVVGKAAAALAVLGKISELHANIISESAVTMLQGTDLKLSYDDIVPHIKNEKGDGWCPLEAACRDAKTPSECLIKIEKALAKMSKKDA